MPVVAYFSKQITNAAPLAAATTVNVNGKPVTSAWYFEHSAAGHGPIEGHLRPETFWPAHAKITVQVATKGLSAGAGLVYSNAFTLNFRTGSADIATVDAVKHLLTLTVDGKRLGAYPVSLGSNQTPTRRGTKVIMSKGSSICMNGPGYNECGVKYTQRVTADGEYLHAAPWNTGNIKLGINSSNGCTNLTTADAKTLFNTLEVGDPVLYPNASGPVMPVSDGYGDWNVQWSTWLTGGLVPTH
jgi:lipoprotein-anchoring transpeptidase ErfK/SrfK